MPTPTEEGATEYETTFRFDERHQGGPGIAHGGLVAAALDEACGLLATWHRFPSVTARIFVRFRRPVHINRDLHVRAWVARTRARRTHTDGELREGGEVLAVRAVRSITWRSSISCRPRRGAPPASLARATRRGSHD